jgi:hypothetical protein
MITEDGRGFLIDWDFAKSIHGEGARSLGRTVSATVKPIFSFPNGP